MSINLRTYFILILSAFVIIFTTVISFAINKESSQSFEKQIGHDLTEKAYQMANDLDHFMWSRYGEITILSNLKTLENQQNPEEINTLLNELKLNFPAYSWIGYTDSSGNVIASTDNILLGENISKRPVFKDALTETFIGDVHEAVLLAKLLPNPTGEDLKFVDISSPIFNEKNDFIGVLASHLSWEWAVEVQNTIIMPNQNKDEELEMFIVSKHDNTILLGPKDMIGQPLQLESVRKAQSGKNGWSLEKWSDEKNYLTGYALADGHLNYPGLEWTVIVRQPEEVAFFSVKELRNQVIIIGLFSVVVFGLIGWFLASIISNPLRQLAISAERLKNGEKTEIPIKRGIHDIETLSTSLRDLISALTKTKSELGKMELIAQLDKLTGLPNRLALDEYLKKLSIHSELDHYAVLYLDLDGFKNINDIHGHHHGDQLLKVVAEKMKGCIRSNEFICRLGGDEFVAIIKVQNTDSVETINMVGNRMIDSLNQPLNIEGTYVTVGCSIGAALWPVHDNESYQVLRYADKALYMSKEKGKNQITLFTKE
ncbi:sensor domain-containing diguanylate cyclase [Litchfieldia salsa]|uniref:Diguanylate cyclase (GGDEF) domain-containing protein n=1 Tax=Litchfieldia salsa TaxID=930152 RepID=A0A1H0TK57_9BACI|nr:diguanylate cyclase [Litchfieldia salsa]SDP53896.1 diguanylate cyclase (GGDEF) domain-containing protein [Litchfieldia salsa]